MAEAAVSGFARGCAHRFASLGDAMRSVLTLLEHQLPTGRVIFAELNYDTDERLNGAFERKLSHRPERLELTFGIERLGDTELAAAALERAEDALGVGPVAHGAWGP